MAERVGFQEFLAANERPLRQALTAACGIDHGREVAADALATLIDVLTPWSWAFDWTNLGDVSSYPSE